MLKKVSGGTRETDEKAWLSSRCQVMDSSSGHGDENQGLLWEAVQR